MKRREFVTLIGGRRWRGRSRRVHNTALPVIGFLQLRIARRLLKDRLRAWSRCRSSSPSRPRVESRARSLVGPSATSCVSGATGSLLTRQETMFHRPLLPVVRLAASPPRVRSTLRTRQPSPLR